MSDETARDDAQTIGLLHCHTENSIDDSTLSTDELCRIAKEMGYTAVSISDHGTCMGWDDFKASAKKFDVKPIFGCELYYKDDVTGMNSHLIAYAKNRQGMVDIGKAMVNGEILPDGRIVMTDESLKWLKTGNVIGTSACIQGPIGSIFLHNMRKNEQIAKLQDEIRSHQDEIDELKKIGSEISAKKSRVSLVKADISDAKKLSKKSFSAIEKRISALSGKLVEMETAFNAILSGDEKQFRKLRSLASSFELTVDSISECETALDEAKRILAQRKAEMKRDKTLAENSVNEVERLSAELEVLNDDLSRMKPRYDELKKLDGRLDTKREKIESLKSELLSKDQAFALIDKRFEKMLDVFGDDFYAEVQYHGIPEEKTIYPFVAKKAKDLGVKLVAANDVHVGYNNEDAFKARQIRRSCRFKKWEEQLTGDRELYIKTEAELAEWLGKILPEEMVKEAIENTNRIAEECTVVFEKESHAPKAKLESSVSDEVKRLCREAIPEKYGERWNEVCEKRLAYETEIVEKMGYMDYFYITYDILNVARKIGGLSYEGLAWMKENAKEMTLERFMQIINMKSKQHVNLSVGLGRGSGAGSIMCYLLGITNVDPIKYDLLFEREKMRS